MFLGVVVCAFLANVDVGVDALASATVVVRVNVTVNVPPPC